MLTTALLATSCAAQKKAAQESRTEAQSSASVQTTVTTRLDSATVATLERMVEAQFRRLRETTIERDEATERVTEIFDTSQPRDSATGTPPLLSRTTERREARQRSDSREQTEAAATDSTKATKATAATLAGETATTAEAASLEMNETKSKEEKRGGNAALQVILSLLPLLLMIVGAAIFTKRLNNH